MSLCYEKYFAEYHERPGWMLNEFMGSTHHTDPDGCDFGHHHNDGIYEHIPSQIDGDQAVADVPRWCDFTSTLVCEDGFVVLNRALVDNVELVVDLLVGLEESRGRMLLQPSPDGADGPDRRQEDALDELIGAFHRVFCQRIACTVGMLHVPLLDILDFGI